jgi:hypothetical protein
MPQGTFKSAFGSADSYSSAIGVAVLGAVLQFDNQWQLIMSRALFCGSLQRGALCPRGIRGEIERVGSTLLAPSRGPIEEDKILDFARSVGL